MTFSLYTFYSFTSYTRYMYIAVPIQEGTHIIKYINFGVLLCVTHSDHLAVPTLIFNNIFKLINCKDTLIVIRSFNYII
jgi:hypothetical protein